MHLVLGVVDAPALAERYAGGARRRARAATGNVLAVSDLTDLPSSQVLFAGLGPWIREPRADAVLAVFAEANRTRGFGDFWGHMLVARGSAEAMVEPELSLWDYAALVPIVEEAGGRMSAMDGGPLRHGGSVLTSNGVIHDELVRRFSV